MPNIDEIKLLAETCVVVSSDAERLHEHFVRHANLIEDEGALRVFISQIVVSTQARSAIDDERMIICTKQTNNILDQIYFLCEKENVYSIRSGAKHCYKMTMANDDRLFAEYKNISTLLSDKHLLQMFIVELILWIQVNSYVHTNGTVNKYESITVLDRAIAAFKQAAN